MAEPEGRTREGGGSGTVCVAGRWEFSRRRAIKPLRKRASGSDLRSRRSDLRAECTDVHSGLRGEAHRDGDGDGLCKVGLAQIGRAGSAHAGCNSAGHPMVALAYECGATAPLQCARVPACCRAPADTGYLAVA